MNAEIIIKEQKTKNNQLIGYVCMNTPKKLNALNIEHIETILQILTKWQEQPNIACVILDTNNTKAFCAGGDLKDLYRLMQAKKNEKIMEYFTNEYLLNYKIHNYPKPIIAWCSGIIMGGGLGLAAGASHRIVNSSTKMAMPEIKIGLYPDAGGSYFLRKIPNKIGLFVGLTAYNMDYADALFTNLADYNICEQNKTQIMQQLEQANWSNNDLANHKLLTEILTAAHETPQKNSWLQEQEQAISTSITQDLTSTISNINQLLTAANKTEIAQNLSNGSPLSKTIIWHQHQKQPASLKQSLLNETICSYNCSINGDFQEGIRAMLIDKDKQPNWKYKTIKAATADYKNYINMQITNNPLLELIGN